MRFMGCLKLQEVITDDRENQWCDFIALLDSVLTDLDFVAIVSVVAICSTAPKLAPVYGLVERAVTD